ncbi:MAG: AMP-binding protein [Polyangiaceae bacterium]|nr:AMP-binding protein [Polyangiaceae bacterium]
MTFTPLGRHAPGSVVAVGDGGERTAADLLRDARAIARTLSEPSSGSQVLVVCGDRYAFAACLLAAWMRGHAVALPPNLLERTADTLSGLPGVRHILHDGEAPGGICVRPILESAAGAPDLAGLPGFAADRPLVTLFTSGTTGAPRACTKTAGQLLGEAEMLGRGPCAGVRRVVSTVPPIHIYGLLFGVLVPLMHGGAFARGTPLHAPSVAAAIGAAGADALVSAPAHLRGLELLGPDDLPRPLRAFSSGAALPQAVGEMLLARFGLAVTEVLGSSETGGIASRNRTGDVWRPLPGVRVSATPDGQMLLDSPFVPPDAERPFACADRIAMNDDGTFRHLGRRDRVVKVASKRVDLDEMQEALLGLPGVSDAAVFAEEAESARGVHVVAAVVAPTWSTRALRDVLSAQFDAVVLPRPLVRVPRLPREPSGKLQLDRLRALLRDVIAQPRRPPRHAFDARPVAAHPGWFDVHVPRDLAYFDGHFDGQPILPGVVQLELLVGRQVTVAWPELTRPRRFTRLKFRSPIRPGDDLVLALVRPDADRVEFEVRRGATVCSSGAIHYGG